MQSSNFLKWIINFIFLFLFFSCTNSIKQNDIKSSYQRLDSFCVVNKICLLDTIKSIFILSDNGCISCSKSFIPFIEKYLAKKHTLFIITASSSRLDLSFLENINHKNIYLDYNKEFEELKIIEKSGVIFTAQNKIDTILELEANQLFAQFNFINQRQKINDF
jgi:hypothetical protein